MKLLKITIITTILLGLVSCNGPDPIDESDMSFSVATYIKNTLDYPILVQCWFKPFNIINWCDQELVSYSEPIEIQPNEVKLVMDYVRPEGIKIFKIDSTLLYENDATKSHGNRTYFSSDVLRYSNIEAKTIGDYVDYQIIPSTWSSVYPFVSKDDPNYYIADDRYLCVNVPWDLYPISFNYFYKCDNYDDETIMLMDNGRKDVYQCFINGYAKVDCIVLNKNAENFK